MKRLYKSRKNRVISGVCGGIAEYFNVDPVLIRVIAVLFFFTGGASLIAYIVGMLIIPDQPWEEAKEGEKSQAPRGPSVALAGQEESGGEGKSRQGIKRRFGLENGQHRSVRIDCGKFKRRQGL